MYSNRKRLSFYFFFNLVYLLKSVLPNVACLSACQHCHYVFIVNLLFKSPKFDIYIFKNLLCLRKKEPLCVYTQVQRFSCFCVFSPITTCLPRFQVDISQISPSWSSCISGWTVLLGLLTFIMGAFNYFCL